MEEADGGTKAALSDPFAALEAAAASCEHGMSRLQVRRSTGLLSQPDRQSRCSRDFTPAQHFLSARIRLRSCVFPDRLHVGTQTLHGFSSNSYYWNKGVSKNTPTSSVRKMDFPAALMF